MLNHIGEILVTNTMEFIAQATSLHNSPKVGTFVKVLNGEETIYAVVHFVTSGSIDNNRRPIAFGKSEKELFLEQPQLTSLLKTEFSALIIGHQVGDNYFGFFSGRPPKIHSFVEMCKDEEVREITEDLGYLQTILNLNLNYTDQVLVSAINNGKKLCSDPRAFLIKTGKNLLTLLKHDMDKFNMIFRRVR